MHKYDWVPSAVLAIAVLIAMAATVNWHSFAYGPW